MFPVRLFSVSALPTVGLVALTVLACTDAGPSGPDPAGTGGDPLGEPLVVARAPLRVFRDVQVVDPAQGTVVPGRAVTLRDGIIESVDDDAGFVAPEGAEVVDGGGAFLAPGLVDMHVHMRSATAEAYIRSGITTVRNMWGFSSLGDIRDGIEAGTLIGPSIYSLSSGLDGPPVHWGETQLLTDPAQADSVVALQYERGYRELKIYQDLAADVYDAIVDAARRREMTFAGHKPSRVPLAHVIESGQRSIEHLGGYLLSGSALATAVDLTVEHGTWVCPTLEIQTRIPAAAPASDQRAAVTRALFDAGARLLVGTDSGIDVTAPGASLVEEMGRFAAAGIPVPAIVRMATVDAAEYLGLSDRIGRVAPGMDADLVLLAEDPLRSLDALRSPLGVHRGDAWIRLR